MIVYVSAIVCLMSATAQLTAAEPKSAAPSKRPNFLFLLADDWGWGDVGAYGANGNYHITGTNTRTLHLDMLAANGTLFTDFHTGQSFCAPSRTAFMTGKFPADLSVNTNWNVGAAGAIPNHMENLPYQLPLPNGTGSSPYPGGLPNVAHILKESGYMTAHYGKWHLGGCSPANETTPAPNEYGFDLTGTYGSPVEAGCVPETATNEYASKSGDKHDIWWSADVGDYIRDHGISFMKSAIAANKPFYLNLWWHMSHDSIDPRPEQYNTTFPFNTTCLFPAKASCEANGNNNCEPCNWQVFWGAQTYSDSHRFGPTIAAVDELGIRDNTYIIFSSDNGAQGERWTNANKGSGPNGDTGGAFSNAVGMQGPFRGTKASSYEGGHRVPFIVSGPNVPKGRVDHSLISGVDYLPTIISLAGATVPQNTMLRGYDISGIWHGEQSNVFERPTGKPLIWRATGSPPPCWNLAPSLAIREDHWKLLFNTDMSRIELFNMSVYNRQGAFFESHNEAVQNPEVVKRLMAIAMGWTNTTMCPFGNTGKNDCHFPNIGGCETYPFPGFP